MIRALPAGLRARAALGTARALVRATYPGSRAITKITKGVVTIDIRGSLFCEVRETSVEPLCGFYASAIARVLQLLRRVRGRARQRMPRLGRAAAAACVSVTLAGRAERQRGRRMIAALALVRCSSPEPGRGRSRAEAASPKPQAEARRPGFSSSRSKRPAATAGPTGSAKRSRS